MIITLKWEKCRWKEEDRGKRELALRPAKSEMLTDVQVRMSCFMRHSELMVIALG